MLQQPSRDEWPGQRGTRRPAKRCQGHCLCRVCGVAHEACELQPLCTMERQMQAGARRQIRTARD